MYHGQELQGRLVMTAFFVKSGQLFLFNKRNLKFTNNILNLLLRSMDRNYQVLADKQYVPLET